LINYYYLLFINQVIGVGIQNPIHPNERFDIGIGSSASTTSSYAIQKLKNSD
jgi:hypothetical protein